MVARRDRGQLLLIGAILLSVVVLGIVVQLNSLQYTDAMGSRTHAEPLEQTAESEASTVADVQTLVAAVRADDPANFERALRENLSTYENYSRNVSAATSGHLVRLDLNESASINETVLRQTPPDSYQKPTPGSGSRNDWTLVEDATLDRFWLNASSANGVGNPFEVVVTNATGSAWRLRVRDVPPSNEMAIETKTSATWTPACTVDQSEVARLDLREGSGSGAASGCSFPSYDDTVERPHTIRFENGNKAGGGYWIEAVGDVRETNFDSATMTEQIRHPAIDYEYRSPATSYNRTIVVDGGTS